MNRLSAKLYGRDLVASAVIKSGDLIEGALLRSDCSVAFADDAFINTQLQLGVVGTGLHAEPFQRFTQGPKLLKQLQSRSPCPTPR